MNDYNTLSDIEAICELLNYSESQFASELGISRTSINNWRLNKNEISDTALEKIYNFAFSKNIRLNKIKEQLYKEDYENDHTVVLFHGAKNNIVDNLSIDKSKADNDFGKGFYCGESFEQSAMFVSGYKQSSIYIAKFDMRNLNSCKFKVDRDWMLTIAYFRNKINEYKNHQIIQSLISKLNNIDYVIAPIADNKMFQIIDDFINGEITDIQCQHCLSATNLGYQYVFITEKALKSVELISHCYLAPIEKEFYLQSRIDESKIGNDKVKLAKREYRGQGLYIDQMLK